MPREATSKRVASIAGKIARRLRGMGGRTKLYSLTYGIPCDTGLTVSDVTTVNGSALTQREPKKRAAKRKRRARAK